MDDDDRTLVDEIPRTARPDAALAEQRPCTPTLTVLVGPQAGHRVSLDLASRAVFIGRDDGNDVAIDDPSLSRRHARVWAERRDGGSVVFIQDLESTNGTLRNERPVQRAELQHGDRILLGDVELRFELLDPVDLEYLVDLERRVDASDRDALTGLLNRGALDRHVADRVARCEVVGLPVSAVMLDLDHFKDVNDKRGHAAGDVVLTRAARLVSEAVRRDDLAIRYGGEEILVVLSGTRRHQAKLLADRLRQLIAAARYPDLDGLVVTASLGVAERATGETIEHWIARADAALYRAKQKGRNRVEAALPPTGR